MSLMFLKCLSAVIKGWSIHVAVANIKASGNFNLFSWRREIALSLISLLKGRIIKSFKILLICSNSLSKIPKRPLNSISVNSEI